MGQPAYSRLRVWSRETGSAVLSRASPLTLHTHAESGDILLAGPFPSSHLTIESVPSISGNNAIAYPMASTFESPPTQGAVVLTVIYIA